MQLKNETAYLKLAAVLAAIGAVAGLGVSLRVPDRYTSSAAVKVIPGADDEKTVEHLTQVQQKILSRNSLAELIQRRSLDLYQRERRMLPLEDIVQNMRTKDIRIAPAPGDPSVVNISFTYPDRRVAQAVAQNLATRFVETNAAVNQHRQSMWRNAWQEDAPPGPVMEVVAQPTDPRKIDGTGRLLFVAAGIILGFVAAAAWRRPKAALQLAALAAAGGIVAVAVSTLIPVRYTSTAVMRLMSPLDPKRWNAAGKPESPADHIRRLEQEVLSVSNIEKIIQKPYLDLYKAERAAKPLDEVVRSMRQQDIRIWNHGAAFSISFSHGDAHAAQAVVRELVTGLMEANAIEARERTKNAGPEFQKMADYKIGENLEVLDPPSFPATPDGPSRLAIAAAGAGAGVLLGIAALFLRRPRGPSPQTAVPIPVS